MDVVLNLVQVGAGVVSEVVDTVANVVIAVASVVSAFF